MDGSSRYQPPDGDIYLSLAATYGRNGALIVADAARSGGDYAVNDALTQVKYGKRLDDSTASNLWRQLTTNPLAAPLESANNQIGTAVKEFFKNPWVIGSLAVAVFAWAGGFQWLGKKLKGKLS